MTYNDTRTGEHLTQASGWVFGQRSFKVILGIEAGVVVGLIRASDIPVFLNLSDAGRSRLITRKVVGSRHFSFSNTERGIEGRKESE
jgi:hypothetical protein